MKQFDKHFLMTLEDVSQYVLQSLDFFEDEEVIVEEIGDGNINYVFRVIGKKSKKSLVIKQADILLRSSQRPLDIDRNRIEAEILVLEGQLAPNLVPKIYKYDPIMCALIMEDISDHKNLRKALLECEIYPNLSEDMSTFLLDTLLPTTDLVMDSFEKKDLVRNYINKDMCKISEDLVFTEPYRNYKGRNVILKGNLEFVEEELYQDEKLVLEAGKLKNKFMNNAQALIHGDLHSGSIFVTKTSTKILDPEFAFYAPMGYDIGNVIGNLFFAWTNALVTRKDEDVTEFLTWIEETIKDIVDKFKAKFLKKYDEIVTDVLAKEENFKNWYLTTVLEDTSGLAGLEIIRRVVGDAKVIDVTGIQDENQRIRAERILILLGKELIKNRDLILNGNDYVEIFKKISTNNL